ncbi:hypothetical protein N0V87_009536 [Didymella glomerata]|uniref:Uncharacterized protein n=1 Tax=Didymella glomerata TaxID=749621 RepID=A0A9W8WQW9_9PLEO|nr:hypothetical protein N0V87_009536 [Didymella glomerata]
MAIFSDLAVELQEAIWKLVLPASRGVHWVEVDGIPHEPDFIRDSIRMTEWYKFDRIPETHSGIYNLRAANPEFNIRVRANETEEESSPFFRHLLTTAPAVFGRPGPDEDSEELQSDLADEIAYTARCRQLSTYSQITALLTACRLSRSIAHQYIQNNRKCSWPIRRSMGMAYRPRPMEVWEAQYGDNDPPVTRSHASWQVLRPQIHALDLVVFRLHDKNGRATSLLKHAPWQYWIEQFTHDSTFACFDRVGIEWHPSWGSVGGRGELRPGNVQAFVRTMVVSHFPVTLYWLVDGVPRPDWDRYPVVRDIFAKRMAEQEGAVSQHLNEHWNLKPEDHAAFSDHYLGQEFEANGRRYYIVFIVSHQFDEEDRDELNKAGLGWRGPFPGSAALWPEALREPVRHAYDIHQEDWANLGTYKNFTYILSWEPIA